MTGLRRLGIKSWVVLALAMWVPAAPTSQPAPNAFSSNDTGLIVNAGTMARLVLEYPKLLNSSGKAVHKLVDRERSGVAAALLSRAGGDRRDR